MNELGTMRVKRWRDDEGVWQEEIVITKAEEVKP
jgi:hypothetical protein